ncbi:MAG: 1-acyl-sn-glycerol-3-phosphate acyltransferase [Spirochaetaceae bacterium]
MIIINFLGTLLYYLSLILLFTITCVFASIIWILTTPFDRNRRINHRIACFVGQCIITLNPFWNTTGQGLEKYNKNETYVIVSNHQSLADIMLLTFLAPLQYKYVAKKELVYVPFIGWIMGMSKYILLNRRDPKSQFKMMKKSEYYLNNNVSVAIFPEGTRSKTGDLLRFKDGASLLSKKTNKKILPVCMVGNNYSMPKKGVIWTKRHPLRMFVLDPIDPSNYKKTKDLTNAVKEAISNKLILETEKQYNFKP